MTPEEENAQLKDCLESLAYQYGIVESGHLHSGAISAMEWAFELLGWDDPRPAPPEMLCDVDGCRNACTCGWPSDKGYRHTCGDHYHSSSR